MHFLFVLPFKEQRFSKIKKNNKILKLLTLIQILRSNLNYPENKKIVVKFFKHVGQSVPFHRPKRIFFLSLPPSYLFCSCISVTPFYFLQSLYTNNRDRQVVDKLMFSLIQSIFFSLHSFKTIKCFQWQKCVEIFWNSPFRNIAP